MPPADGHDARSDQQLVAAINAGDQRAFEALYRRYRDWAVNVAYRFTSQREAALDVMQEAFIYVLGKFPGFELRARFTTFLYPVLRHIAQQQQRKYRKEAAPIGAGGGAGGTSDGIPDAEAVAHDPPAQHEQLSTDTREALAVLLADMPVAQREVLVLRYVDQMSEAEIAEAMDVPRGTVKSRLHHALRRLRDDPRTAEYFGVSH